MLRKNGVLIYLFVAVLHSSCFARGIEELKKNISWADLGKCKRQLNWAITADSSLTHTSSDHVEAVLEFARFSL